MSPQQDPTEYDDALCLHSSYTSLICYFFIGVEKGNEKFFFEEEEETKIQSSLKNTLSTTKLRTHGISVEQPR